MGLKERVGAKICPGRVSSSEGQAVEAVYFEELNLHFTPDCGPGLTETAAQKAEKRSKSLVESDPEKSAIFARYARNLRKANRRLVNSSNKLQEKRHRKKIRQLLIRVGF